MTVSFGSELTEEGLSARFASLLSQRWYGPSRRSMFVAVLSLYSPVIDRSWEELAERASKCLGVGYLAFRWLQGDAARAGRLESHDRKVAETFTRLLRIVAESDHRDAFAESMSELLARSDPQARLEALLANRPSSKPPLSQDLLARLRALVNNRPDERIDIAASLEQLAKGKIKDVSLLAPFSPRASDALAEDIDRLASVALLCLSRGLLAGVHAEFNLAVSALMRRQPSPIDAIDAESMHDVTARLVNDTENWLRRRQKGIYGVLVMGQPAEAVVEAALALAGDTERHLPEFVRAQAAIRLAMVRLREEGKGTAAERLGRLGARAGALTREALASYCASYRLALSVLGPNSARDVAAVLGKADALPFTTSLPNGKDTTLNSLNASLEGAFVEIEGFVTTVEAEREADGKLISHLTLLDPSSGATANAVAVFAHLPHAGVTRDAFCRLSGVFRMQSTLLQGRPAVEVDVLSLSELSKASWWIAFLRLAEAWFQPWRNNANLTWSLGVHSDEVGLFGAGELLFSPLIRR